MKNLFTNRYFWIGLSSGVVVCQTAAFYVIKKKDENIIHLVAMTSYLSHMLDENGIPIDEFDLIAIKEMSKKIKGIKLSR